MTEQYIENILIRRITESGTAIEPPVTVDDIEDDYDFRGIIRLKRVNTSNSLDSEGNVSGFEYVFDIISVNKFQKQS